MYRGIGYGKQHGAYGTHRNLASLGSPWSNGGKKAHVPSRRTGRLLVTRPKRGEMPSEPLRLDPDHVLPTPIRGRRSGAPLALAFTAAPLLAKVLRYDQICMGPARYLRTHTQELVLSLGRAARCSK